MPVDRLADRRDPATGSGTIAFILTNPPTTSGTRTLARIELMRTILGYRQAVVANLFALPSYRSGGLAVAGKTDEGWLAARPRIEAVLPGADAVLLAYGVQPPTGAARIHFEGQVAWLHALLAEQGLPTFQVGDGPRHPSRWQRWTHRSHPTLDFSEALRRAVGEAL